MTRKKLRATLFGPPGSGKGTQGQLLADRFDIPLISVGDLFRAEINEGTTLGKLAKKYVESGALAPDELGNAIVANQLKRLDLSHGFIIDGYPRTVEQAQHLDRIARLNLAILLKLSDREALRRLTGRLQCGACQQLYQVTFAPPIKPGICALCGRRLKQRVDDTEELIKKRLANYHFITEPLAAYYRQRGILLTINGEQPIPYVFEDIVKKMAKLGFQS